jgi:hypothetical protein
MTSTDPPWTINHFAAALADLTDDKKRQVRIARALVELVRALPAEVKARYVGTTHPRMNRYRNTCGTPGSTNA